MKRLVIAGLVAVTMTGLWAGAAWAQRDAGAKARGDMRSFWDPGYRRSANTWSYFRSDSRPVSPATEGYRSFSYEPIGIRAGDRVVVQGNDVRLMRGTNVVGMLPEGTEVLVTKVTNGWLGTVVEVNGQQLNGWVWHDNVSIR